MKGLGSVSQKYLESANDLKHGKKMVAKVISKLSLFLDLRCF